MCITHGWLVFSKQVLPLPVHSTRGYPTYRTVTFPADKDGVGMILEALYSFYNKRARCTEERIIRTYHGFQIEGETYTCFVSSGGGFKNGYDIDFKVEKGDIRAKDKRDKSAEHAVLDGDSDNDYPFTLLHYVGTNEDPEYLAEIVVDHNSLSATAAEIVKKECMVFFKTNVYTALTYIPMPPPIRS